MDPTIKMKDSDKNFNEGHKRIFGQIKRYIISFLDRKTNNRKI